MTLTNIVLLPNQQPPNSSIHSNQCLHHHPPIPPYPMKSVITSPTPILPPQKNIKLSNVVTEIVIWAVALHMCYRHLTLSLKTGNN